jgi:hypothetical protein
MTNYYGNSTTGADQGQDTPDDDGDGWECPHCLHVFWIARTWSYDGVNGALCPKCSKFIPNDELGVESD